VQRQPHLNHRASQEAAWQAVVKVSGVDFSPVCSADNKRARVLPGDQNPLNASRGWQRSGRWAPDLPLDIYADRIHADTSPD